MYSKRLWRFTSALTLGLLGTKYGVQNAPKHFVSNETEDKSYKNVFQGIKFPDFFPKVLAVLPDCQRDNMFQCDQIRIIPYSIEDELTALSGLTGMCVPIKDFDGSEYQTISARDYKIVYNTRRRCPHFAVEYLTKEKLNVTDEQWQNLYRGNWFPDTDIPMYYQTNNSLYKQPYVRAPMAAPRNHMDRNDNYKETFKFVNTAPMNPCLQSTAWRILEEYVVQLAQNPMFSEVFVITGPLFMYHTYDHCKLLHRTHNTHCGWRSPKKMAENVPIPTHFFKIILFFTEGRCQSHLISYVMPNTDVKICETDCHKEILRQFLVPINTIENFLGFKFFPYGYDYLSSLSPKPVKRQYSEHPKGLRYCFPEPFSACD